MKTLLGSAEDTHRFGQCLGAAAERGLVLTAHGELGAGKTTLAQGVARGLGVPVEHYVNSPTFAIAQVHPGRLPFYHLDLYRLADIDEAWGIGLEEMVGTDGVCFIEWASRCPELLPDERLILRLTGHEMGRALELSATGPEAERILRRVCILARQDGFVFA
ncbi:MAG: tRNA (adenosine(37)-N6)-threonylcarbamoyltransferase complex ATPase subunit type 1 TsaE [Myxococcota bacterium]|nr:tRNA (adenosine(37)-N6)-threonylcarbamoyltransferase complex ATPase subunit type 1 TsaE [Myxococcota bacterium]